MIHLDEDALICDLAETYHVLNYRELSPKLVAVLCSGLSPDSRIKRKIVNRNLKLDEYLLAAIVDRLSLLVWFKTEDGQKNRNKPKSIVKAFEEPPSEPQYKGFNTVEEFERKRAELLGV